MKLPDELGTDTCKRLKDINSDVKVLYTSGLGRIPGGDSLECGCDGFLSAHPIYEGETGQLKRCTCIRGAYFKPPQTPVYYYNLWKAKLSHGFLFGS